MENGRLMVDASGVEWEVYDESQWTITLALDWEYPPQSTDPGLLFDSVLGKRRIFPCPENWRSLTDTELERLLWRSCSLT